MVGWKPKPFIFVHIPKCAGTSIEKAFIPVVSNHNDFRDLSEAERDKHWLPGRAGKQHAKLRWYHRRFSLGAYFKFAFVRNPWDRAISQIDYLRAKTGKRLFSGTDFRANLKIYCTARNIVWGHDLGAAQVDYLRDLQGDLCMDFIGRFESLAEDFARICSLLGLDQAPTLPHIFSSNRTQHYSAFYDEESAGWIRERFSKDVDFFGYEFEEARTPDHRTAPALECP